MAVDEITSNRKASVVPSTFPKERGGESACVARRGSRSVYFRRMVRFFAYHGIFSADCPVILFQKLKCRTLPHFQRFIGFKLSDNNILVCWLLVRPQICRDWCWKMSIAKTTNWLFWSRSRWVVPIPLPRISTPTIEIVSDRGYILTRPSTY
jgi:hypothetical protein